MLKTLAIVFITLSSLILLAGCGSVPPRQPEVPEQLTFSPEEAFRKYTGALAAGNPEEAYKHLAKGRQMVYPLKRYKEDYLKEQDWKKKVYSKIKLLPGTTVYMKQRRLAVVRVEWSNGLKTVWLFKQEIGGWKFSEELILVRPKGTPE